MNHTKQKRLDFAIAGLQRRWGSHVIVPARQVQPEQRVISTGFPELDRVLGGGIPLSAITLISGQTTSGKLTLTYKILRRAQQSATTSRSPRVNSVAILDLSASGDPDYVARCGIDLDHLLLVRPRAGKQAIDILGDLVRSRQLGAILLDGLPDLRTDPAAARYFDHLLPQLCLFLKATGCALIILDELQPPWLQWLTGIRSNAIQHCAALQIELRREHWIESKGELRGYQAEAHILKSQRTRPGQVARIAIEFNATVRARDTW